MTNTTDTAAPRCATCGALTPCDRMPERLREKRVDGMTDLGLLRCWLAQARGQKRHAAELLLLERIRELEQCSADTTAAALDAVADQVRVALPASDPLAKAAEEGDDHEGDEEITDDHDQITGGAISGASGASTGLEETAASESASAPAAPDLYEAAEQRLEAAIAKEAEEVASAPVLACRHCDRPFLLTPPPASGYCRACAEWFEREAGDTAASELEAPEQVPVHEGPPPRCCQCESAGWYFTGGAYYCADHVPLEGTHPATVTRAHGDTLPELPAGSPVAVELARVPQSGQPALAPGVLDRIDRLIAAVESPAPVHVADDGMQQVLLDRLDKILDILQRGIPLRITIERGQP
jgi:hypothetical protein